MENKPLVSCLCCSYGRILLLEEAIKCYLDQDYPNKELIILNDKPDVILRLPKQDDVRIFNNPTRFNSLGEKRNYIKTLASKNTEYFCVFDDDDLYMPYRIKESVEAMESHKGYDIGKAINAIISTNNVDYKVANNLFHSQAIITKEYMNKTSYPNISVGEDREFEKNAKILNIDVGFFSHYIYRWGNTHHVSGLRDEKESWNKSINYYKDITGEIILKPRFQRDYWKEVRDYLVKINPDYGTIWDKKIEGKVRDYIEI